MELIKLENIYKNYTCRDTPEVKVLRNISLTIEKGDFLAIKGPSGAGKSTLLHILGCIDTPTSGNYIFDGENINKLNSFQLAKIRNKRIGFVLQSFGLILEETAIENVKLPMYFSNISREEMTEKANKMLEIIGLKNLANQKVMHLSGGEKQRVAIARSLINDPDIILADEPTGALDTSNSDLLMDIFEDLNRHARTIVIVTHDNSISKKCKNIINIRDGVI